MTSDTEKVLSALRITNWDNVSIGNKVIVLAAIMKIEDLDRELTKALNLLVAARDFSNQTVIDHHRFAAHRRELDAFMTGKAGDKPEDRYDSPERKEARAFVNSLFRRQDRRPGMRKKPQNRQDLPG